MSEDTLDYLSAAFQLTVISIESAQEKSNYPEKLHAEVFSKEADAVISRQATAAEKLAAIPKRKALEKEFWETL